MSEESVTIGDFSKGISSFFTLSIENFQNFMLDGLLRFKEPIKFRASNTQALPHISLDANLFRYINGDWMEWGVYMANIDNVVFLKTKNNDLQFHPVDQFKNMLDKGFLKVVN